MNSKTNPLSLEDVIINIPYFKSSHPLKHLVEVEMCSIHSSFGTCISLETMVINCGAVMSCSRLLVDVGDFVEVNTKVLLHKINFYVLSVIVIGTGAVWHSVNLWYM